MKYILWLFVSLLWVECNSTALKSVNEPKNSQIYIPIEIVSNYFYKYFRNSEVFISISMSSSSEVQKYFQNDMITELVKHSRFSNFTYNILDTMDQ